MYSVTASTADGGLYRFEMSGADAREAERKAFQLLRTVGKCVRCVRAVGVCR